MKNKKLILAVLVLLLVSRLFAVGTYVKSGMYVSADIQDFSLLNQLQLEEKPTEIPQNATFLAVGNPDYMVRPGDIYLLSFYDGVKTVDQHIQVDSSMVVEIAGVGSLSAKGKTYSQFKNEVEDYVKLFYSYAKPTFSLQNCGIYNVYVKGEVRNSCYVTVWGLTTLSELVQYATEYASSREIKITTSDGQTKSYDLYAALKNGEKEQNPYLEPNSTVEFVKSDSTVCLAGAVRRPGIYQLKDGETAASLINSYGDGFTRKADSSFVTVERYENGNFSVFALDSESLNDFYLEYGDSVQVLEKQNALPYVTVSGAIEPERIYYRFFAGETGQQLVENIEDCFGPNSNVEGITVTRNGRLISISEPLVNGDVVSVPYIQQYVTVSGAVRSPGKFSFEPGKDASYYIHQAGGFSQDASRSSLKVLDVDSNVVKDSEVLANSVINVEFKDTSFKENIALAASVLGLITTIMSLIK